MWIDVDNDETKRQDDLERLLHYDPAPSFILSSGGGWHAYWLLEKPFELQNDADRQQIANTLHGLFADLSGDPGYVKSVASVMRLPDSLNTKPERRGVAVEIVEYLPERRYPLAAFAWLETRAKREHNGGVDATTSNGTGKTPLPPRTEHYLASGAPTGSRYAELFAVACQLRDVGYSQRDAERDLVARYTTDGSGSEPTATREKEARATIASAYSRPAR